MKMTQKMNEEDSKNKDNLKNKDNRVFLWHILPFKGFSLKEWYMWLCTHFLITIVPLHLSHCVLLEGHGHYDVKISVCVATSSRPLIGPNCESYIVEEVNEVDELHIGKIFAAPGKQDKS